MSFNPNIPLATDNTLQSAPQLRANFREIAAAWGENHVPLNALVGKGQHELLNFLAQNVVPTTTATQVSLYNKTVSSVPTLFFKPNNNQTAITLTYPSIVNTGDDQYSFCAGPFIIYGGIKRNATNGQVVNLTPGTTLVYVDLLMTNVNGATAFINSQAIPTNVAGNSFTITYKTTAITSVDIFYFAIGLP